MKQEKKKKKHDKCKTKIQQDFIARTKQGLLSWAWKQPSLQDFLNENENKGIFNPKPKSWNKKSKNKNTTNAQQKFNKILLQEWNKTKRRL